MPAPPEPSPTGFPAWEVAVDLAALVVSLVTSLIVGTWTLAKGQGRGDKKLAETKLDLERKIDAETDNTVHDFGETVAAIRQKMTDMELWNRDTFVTKSTFDVVMQQLRSDAERLEDKIDNRFDRLEAKLERENKLVGGK